MMRTAKETLGVVIYTQMFKIVGDVHLYENSRLTDMLNVDTNKKDFIPVTNVHVYSLDDKLLYQKDFLSVNRQYIVLIYIDDSSLKAMKDIIKQGHAYIAKKAFQEAIAEGKRAVSINPNDAEAHYLLGLAYAKSNMLNEAWEEFKLASAFAPKNSQIEHMALEMLSRIKV